MKKMLGVGLGLAVSGGVLTPWAPVNAETVAYAATITPAASIGLQQAIDAAITFAKTGADASWFGQDQIIFPGLSDANMKSPGTNDATHNGVKSDRKWVSTDGVSTTINLMNPTVGTNQFVQNSAHFSVQRMNGEPGLVRESGWFDGTDGVATGPRTSGNQTAYRINQATAASNANNSSFDATALICVSRTASNNTKAYRDGVVTTDTSAANQASTALNNSILYLGRGDATSFFAGDWCYASIGAGFTAAQAANEATFVQMILAAMDVNYGFAPYAVKTADTIINLPDAIGGDIGEGFTGTGMSRIPGENNFICGSYGGSTEADVTFNPGLVEISMAGALLSQVAIKDTFPTVDTVQGVAINPLDNTVWFVAQNLGQVLHCTRAGAVLSGGYTDAGINGLAIDTLRNKLIISKDAAGTIYRANFDASSPESVITGFTNVDQVSYCAEKDWILASSGANGVAGVCIALDAATFKIRRIWQLNSSLSVEGLYLDPITEKLHVLNDGYFHGTGTLKNTLQIYNL